MSGISAPSTSRTSRGSRDTSSRDTRANSVIGRPVRSACSCSSARSTTNLYDLLIGSTSRPRDDLEEVRQCDAERLVPLRRLVSVTVLGPPTRGATAEGVAFPDAPLRTVVRQDGPKRRTVGIRGPHLETLDPRGKVGVVIDELVEESRVELRAICLRLLCDRTEQELQGSEPLLTVDHEVSWNLSRSRLLLLEYDGPQEVRQGNAVSLEVVLRDGGDVLPQRTPVGLLLLDVRALVQRDDVPHVAAEQVRQRMRCGLHLYTFSIRELTFRDIRSITVRRLRWRPPSEPR